MPFSFLVPAFLAGLAALAIPVLLHLRQRDRERPLRFPSLMFLRRIPIETAHRRRVTDLPLLLLRALAVLLAVLAFSRPVIQRVSAVLDADSERVVIVALDRSLSMGHTAVWPAALDSARAVISALSAGDRIGVIAFDDEAEVMQPITTDKAAALASLGTVRPGARGTRFAAALRAARQQVLAGNIAQAEVVVVSDLQRSGTGGVTDLALPTGITVRGVSVAAPSAANSAVTSVAVERLGGGVAGRIAVVAEVRGRALGSLRSTVATLTVNNRPAGSRPIEVPTDGALRVAFDPVPLPPGEAQVTVAIEADALAADDAFHAVVPAEATQRVVLVTPGDLSAEATLFAERALEIGSDPAFRVERRNVAALDASLLEGTALVLFVDVVPPGTTALRSWLEAGHGAVVVAGPRIAASRTRSELVGARAEGEVDRLGERGGTIGDVALEHPVFVPFRGGGSAALSSARFIRYARMVPDSGVEVIARFDDGTPALMEQQIGSGRLIVSAIPLDVRGGDFPLQPAYLPFMRRLALHAAGYQPQPLWRTAGEGWRPAARVSELVIATPSGALVRPDSGGVQGAARLSELGFYQAYAGRAAGEPLGVAAVNATPRESDLTPSPPSELLLGIQEERGAATAIERLPASEVEQRQRLWRILLVLVLVVLAGESLLGSRGWRGRAMRMAPDAPQREANA
jgi:hypothetical protein